MVVRYCRDVHRKETGGVPVFEILLIVPVVLFVLFLCLKLRSHLSKLRHAETLTAPLYYGLLWGLSFFTILRCLFNFFLPADTYPVYDLCFMLVYFFLLVMEAGVVFFRTKRGPLVGTRQLLRKFLLVCVGVALSFTTPQAVLIFRLHLPIFQTGVIASAEGDSNHALVYWLSTFVALAAFYAVLLGLIKWVRPVATYFAAQSPFLLYLVFMLVFYVFRATTTLFAILHVPAGYCMFDLSRLLFTLFHLPLLYWTLLWRFFREAKLAETYSEMVVSGYFDSDM
ncbi:Transmembrane protein adipocyte-associated 1 [Balamuthia mandrillaris]